MCAPGLEFRQSRRSREPAPNAFIAPGDMMNSLGHASRTRWQHSLRFSTSRHSTLAAITRCCRCRLIASGDRSDGHGWCLDEGRARVGNEVGLADDNVKASIQARDQPRHQHSAGQMVDLAAIAVGHRNFPRERLDLAACQEALQPPSKQQGRMRR